MEEVTLSASQISVYRDECKRKWALKSIAKLETPQNASAALGTEVDNEQLQPYLKHNRTFDYSRDSGYIAASALAFLPLPNSNGLEVQKHFSMPSFTKDSGLRYQGYIDLWMPNGGMPDFAGAPVVCDFKTTGNLKWQKSPEVLKTDVQAMLYATYGMFATNQRTVDLVWIYMQTKGPRKAKRTHLRVVGSHVYDQFGKINEIALEMRKTRLELVAGAGDRPLSEVAMDLPPNPSACDGFGGCPFRSLCNLSPSVFVEAATANAIQAMETIDMSETSELFAQLKAKRAGKALPTSTPTAAPVAVAQPVVVPVGINPPESLLPPAPLPDEIREVATPEAAAPKKGRAKAQSTDSSAPDVSRAILAGLEAFTAAFKAAL